MDKAIQSIRGMHDILPEHTPTWQHIESVVRKQFDQYSYKEIRMPLVEPTALFIRSIGEVTDIVEKEMYTFDDRNEESLTLRPEGTAGCVRAGLQHGLFHNQQQRLWYSGPMFRYEKPQKGRYRQFHQAGAEAFGFSGVDIEIELIALARRIFTSLDLNNIELQINSIGSLESRNTYKQALVAFYQQHLEALDDDSKRRLTSNPLRILDSKNPTVIAVNENAPSLLNYLDDESKQSFDDLQQYLTKLSIDFTVNDRLVRGLDYYNGLVFEWVSQELGAQGTVCAGGRYNGLLKQMGGRDGHACGFGIGLERLWLLFEQQHGLKNKDCDFFMCLIGENAQQQGIILAEKLRDAVPNLRLAVNAGGGSFKSQIKKADKSGAAYALILAEDELANGQVTIKPLRTEQAQDAVPVESLATSLEQLQTAILGAT